jgi:hypothetical protein
MKIKQLVLVCLLAMPFFVQAQKLYTYPIGVQAYTFRNQFPKDVAKTLDLIQSMGITEIEGGAQKGQTTEQFKYLMVMAVFLATIHKELVMYPTIVTTQLLKQQQVGDTLIHTLQRYTNK